MGKYPDREYDNNRNSYNGGHGFFAISLKYAMRFLHIGQFCLWAWRSSQSSSVTVSFPIVVALQNNIISRLSSTH
jgi:hypothetical protein